MSAALSLLRGFLPRIGCGTGFRWSLLAPLALLLLATFAFLWKVGDRALWDSAEIASAQAMRQVLTGAAAGPDAGCALLHAWLMAASSRLLGAASPLALRLPSALAALVLVAFLVGFGRRAFDARTGLLSGVVFIVSFGALVAARSATNDALLAAAATVSAFLLFESRDRAPSSLAWFAPGLAMGAGVLAAGGAALLLPLAVVLLHQSIARRGNGALNALLAAALGASVSVLALALTPLGTGRTVSDLVALLPHRVASNGAVLAVLLALAPWTLFVPSAVIVARREASTRGGPSSFLLCALGVAALYGAWAGLSASALGIFVLPCASLLVARLWSISLDEPDPAALRWRIGLPFVLSVLTIPTAGWLGRERVQGALGIPEPLALQGCVFLLFVSIWVSTFVLVRRTGPRFAGLAAASIAALSFATLWGLPRLDATRRERLSRETAILNAHPAFEILPEELVDAEPLPGLRRGPIAGGPSDVVDYLSSSERVFCLMDQASFAALRAQGVRELHLVLTRRMGARTLVLVSNQDPGEQVRQEDEP